MSVIFVDSMEFHIGFDRTQYVGRVDQNYLDIISQEVETGRMAPLTAMSLLSFHMGDPNEQEQNVLSVTEKT